MTAFDFAQIVTPVELSVIFDFLPVRILNFDSNQKTVFVISEMQLKIGRALYEQTLNR